MIGVNDSAGETFTLEDAQVVVNYALANSDKIALLSFWSIGRDNGVCSDDGLAAVQRDHAKRLGLHTHLPEVRAVTRV